MLLIHGTDDSWVPPEQSARLAGALKRAAVKHRFIQVEGARHGFEAHVKTLPERDLLPEILDFLDGSWK
jgi:dipeptidyl aminopeptidase/acylaminoacyl peptidase